MRREEKILNQNILREFYFSLFVEQMDVGRVFVTLSGHIRNAAKNFFYRFLFVGSFFLLTTYCLLLTFPVQSFAQEVEYIPVEDLTEPERFRLYNPNGQKYAFTRSFISSLSYFHRMSQRLRQEDPAKEKYEQDHGLSQAFLEALIADNFDLRVAKGYLKKYLSSPSQFIEKVAGDTIQVYEDLIDVNEQEQLLWERLYRAQRNPDENYFDYDAYETDLRQVLHQRAQVLRRLPEMASLVAKIMTSERAEELGYGFQLGITKEERQLLLEKLDQYAEDNLAWGMEEGQSSIDASVAIIREMLEDPVYSTLDES